LIALLLIIAFPLLLKFSAQQSGYFTFDVWVRCGATVVILILLVCLSLYRLKQWRTKLGRQSTYLKGLAAAYGLSISSCILILWFHDIHDIGRSLAFFIYVLISVPLACFEVSRPTKDVETDPKRIAASFVRAWGVVLSCPIMIAMYLFVSEHDRRIDWSRLGALQLSDELVSQFESEISKGLVVELYLDPDYSFSDRIGSFFEPLHDDITLVNVRQSPSRAAGVGFKMGAKLRLVAKGEREDQTVEIDFPLRRSEARDLLAGLETRLASVLSSYRAPDISVIWRDDEENRTDIPIKERAALNGLGHYMKLVQQELGKIDSTERRATNRSLWVISGFSNQRWQSPQTLAEKIIAGDSCLITANRLYTDMSRHESGGTLLSETKSLLSALGVTVGPERILRQPVVSISASAADRHYVMADIVEGHAVTAAMRRNLQHAPRLLLQTASPVKDTEPSLDSAADLKSRVKLFSAAHEGNADDAYVMGFRFGEGRVVVAADRDFLSDDLIGLESNALFLRMSLRWLRGVKLSHLDQYRPSDLRIVPLKRSDRLWVGLIVFGIPLLVLLIGAIFFFRLNKGRIDE